MRRLFLVVTSLALLLATPLFASAQEDPGALLTKMAELDNAKDAEGMLALFAPDGVIVAPGPDAPDKTQTYTGTDQIREWIKEDMEGDAADDRTELGDITVQGDTASAPFKAFSNDAQLMQAGLDPITGTAELTAKDGKVARFTITIDPAWVQKVEAVMAAQGGGAEAAATPAATSQAATGGAAPAEAMGPGKLPATGDASDPLPLPLALAAAVGLLGLGIGLRRASRAT
jgi:ketosteroid isomerase-like protein